MKLFLCYIVIDFALVLAITTPDPLEGGDEESESEQDLEDEDGAYQVPERTLMAAEFFSDTITRERAVKMMKRAIELIEKPQSASKRPCRRDPDLDIAAKNTLRYLTGEPPIGSTSEDSSRASSGQQQREYCPNENIFDNQRRVSNFNDQEDSWAS